MPSSIQPIPTVNEAMSYRSALFGKVREAQERTALERVSNKMTALSFVLFFVFFSCAFIFSHRNPVYEALGVIAGVLSFVITFCIGHSLTSKRTKRIEVQHTYIGLTLEVMERLDIPRTADEQAVVADPRQRYVARIARAVDRMNELIHAWNSYIEGVQCDAYRRLAPDGEERIEQTLRLVRDQLDRHAKRVPFVLKDPASSQLPQPIGIAECLAAVADAERQLLGATVPPGYRIAGDRIDADQEAVREALAIAEAAQALLPNAVTRA